MKMCEQILKNIARRIPETTRRKLPQLMTKQLEQLLWTPNLHKCYKIFKEEYKRHSKTNWTKKLEKLKDFF